MDNVREPTVRNVNNLPFWQKSYAQFDDFVNKIFIQSKMLTTYLVTKVLKMCTSVSYIIEHVEE
jgi:hypothetical protein